MLDNHTSTPETAKSLESLGLPEQLLLNWQRLKYEMFYAPDSQLASGADEEPVLSTVRDLSDADWEVAKQRVGGAALTGEIELED